MSRTFSDSIEADVAAIFLNTDEFAVTVTLQRGIKTTTDIAALVATNRRELQQPGAIEIDVEHRDYRIKATSYAIDAVAVMPRDGDRITETLHSGTAISSEVLPINGMPCYELDSSGMTLLVRTKRIS